MNGFTVILCDIEDSYLENAIKRIGNFMEKSVARGKMTENQKQETLGRIHMTLNQASPLLRLCKSELL